MYHILEFTERACYYYELMQNDIIFLEMYTTVGTLEPDITAMQWIHENGREDANNSTEPTFIFPQNSEPPDPSLMSVING